VNVVERQERIESFASFCRARRVPFTAQRRTILEAVLDLDDHPTAEQVHTEVVHRLPGVSRTTVYRTLETLVRAGLLLRTSHIGPVLRYDTTTRPHHHLVCLKCGRLVDIACDRVDPIVLPDVSDVGFEVRDYSVQIRGVCPDCRRQEET
jgi:Fur family peroxide stress response transcriptional regulator